MNALSIDCMRETEYIVGFIKDTFKEKGFSRAVIGISGGLDSAVIAALCVRALGKENVIGVMLPYGEQKDIEDAYSVGESLGILCYEFNIECMTDNYGLSGCNNQIRIGNIKARVRMIYLYDLSSAYNALVVGTGNRTELELGYFTLYGDGACALEPIGHLYKTQVKQLAKYLGVPQGIIDKAPSAGLWEGQTDEEDLGASYEEIDEILSYMYVDTTGMAEGSYIKKDSINQDLFERVWQRISKNRFKSELPKMLEV